MSEEKIIKNFHSSGRAARVSDSFRTWSDEKPRRDVS
jgi:hypothetical protein